MDDPAAQRIWNAALGQLQIHVTRPNYDTWLKDTVGLRLEDGHFVVGAPTEFVKEWLATRMRSLVCQTVENILGRPVEVTFEITGHNGHSGNGHGLPLTEAVLPQAVASSPSPRPRLNPKYTFATFVVGDSNRLAAAAATAAAERPGDDYNPLFIYSQPGLGKTHLLHAISQRVNGRHRSAYVTSEQFTNEFVTAIAHGRADEFRRRYRSLQLLLVDDIQFFAGKERTQEEFFYTFNDLHSNGCQVVVACDRPPTALPGLEARLRSRFQWGLIADIQPPDNEMRLAILRSKALQQQVDLPPEVAQFLANRVRDNIRELEGSLNRVVAYARLTSAPAITTDLATRALSALKPCEPTLTSPQAILKAVSNYFSLAPGALAATTRARPIAEARHIAMYLLREDAQLALKEIGHLLGGRDHSTVIHGLRKVAAALTSDPRVASQIVELRRHLAT
ncbi:MAG TPA: chromosomal replication initiator protein DnaA [Dehalococcoidia bacterium]|nr:chromosomal replication initiator protein DnaA [Dehalococcoidia bacterium]